MIFPARLSVIRATPARADNADNVHAVVRLQFEAADVDPQWLFSQLGEMIQLDLSEYVAPKLPLEVAIEATNGRVVTNAPVG
jgi:hypothetical protein